MDDKLGHRKRTRNHSSSQEITSTETASSEEFVWFSLISVCVKLLLVPSYHSTDFEVHRNWLAITHSLPLQNWYLDETSPWTLDYPPFFAYFELLLSKFASLFDPTIVDLYGGLNYEANSAIYFQRITVMVSDTVLHYSIYRITRNHSPSRRRLIWVLIMWSPSLLMVDHIHFQYNGFLLGLLILSVSALEDGNDLLGGFLFSVLLCFKHLFAVAAPVYFVYLLKHYCRGGLVKGFGRLLMMGMVVMSAFVAAFGPFVYHGQMMQVIRRMFPFGRGLCHAYWAPNFWVFYILLDKVLASVLRKLGFVIAPPAASFTGGLVGDSSPFCVLPQVTPLTSLILVLLALSPCIYKSWSDAQPKKITRWIAYAYTCGFFFGWHVHEKASLHFVIPLAIVAVNSMNDAKHYFILATVSCYSLFPLLFEPREYPIKVLLLLLHSSLIYFGFSSIFSGKEQLKSSKHSEEGAHVGSTPDESNVAASKDKCRFGIGLIDKSYLLGLLFVEAWGQFLHPVILADRFPFLPLMMVSTYCTFGIFYSWIWQLKSILATS